MIFFTSQGPKTGIFGIDLIWSDFNEHGSILFDPTVFQVAANFLQFATFKAIYFLDPISTLHKLL